MVIDIGGRDCNWENHHVSVSGDCVERGIIELRDSMKNLGIGAGEALLPVSTSGRESLVQPQSLIWSTEERVCNEVIPSAARLS